jgi:hypothetical protein
MHLIRSENPALDPKPGDGPPSWFCFILRLKTKRTGKMLFQRKGYCANNVPSPRTVAGTHTSPGKAPANSPESSQHVCNRRAGLGRRWLAEDET